MLKPEILDALDSQVHADLLAMQRERDGAKGRIDPRFSAAARQKEIDAIDADYDQRERGRVGTLEAEITNAAEQQLKAIDLEGVVPEPVQSTLETGADFAARIAKTQLLEWRAAQKQSERLMGVTGSLATLASLTDPADAAFVQSVLDDAFATGNAPVIQRVSLLAVGRLRAMAIEERRRTNSSDGAAAGPVEQLYLATTARVDDWKQEEAKRSPEARRQRVIRDRQAQLEMLRRGHEMLRAARSGRASYDHIAFA
jgi:hypothetical protein